MLFFGLLVAFENQIDCRSVGKLRGAAEAAILDVEELGDGFDLRVDGAEVKVGASAGEHFRLRDGIRERVGCALELGALVAEGIGDGEEQAAKTEAAHLVFGREIGATKKRFAIWKQKSGERPAALAGD